MEIERFVEREGEESDFDYTLLETFVLFDELSKWLFNFIEEVEESDSMKRVIHIKLIKNKFLKFYYTILSLLILSFYL